MDSRGSTGSDLDHVNSISSWITYDSSAICRRSLKILCIKNTAPSALQHQNLFICLRSCLLCFFSLTSSGADGFSAINQGPRKFTQSKCTARAGACHAHKDGAQLVGIIGEEGGKNNTSFVVQQENLILSASIAKWKSWGIWTILSTNYSLWFTNEIIFLILWKSLFPN